jgi:hypothetical protein
MGRSLQHYLNDQCSRVLRNLPYPIKQKVLGFPPIRSTSKNAVVAVLCSHKQFLEGLWSLWSWMGYVSPVMCGILLVDGKVTREQKDIFQKLFPGGRLLELSVFLASRNLPSYLVKFIAGNIYGKKLAAVYELQKDFNVLYSDCDITAFDNPAEIIGLIQESRSAYMYDSVGFSLDPWFSSRAKKAGIPLTPHFNAGLVYVPKGAMKEAVIEDMLGDWHVDLNTHFSEQTLFSILLDWKNATPLPKERYVLSWQGVWAFEKDLDPNGIVCRHYTGPTRHRMYLSAYPYLLNKSRAEKRTASQS